MILEAVISTELSSQAVWCWSPVVWLRRIWRHVGDVVTCPALWMQHRGSAEISSQLQPWPVVSLSIPRPGWVLRLIAGVLFTTVCLPWPECNASAPQGSQELPTPPVQLTSQLCQESHVDTGCGNDSFNLVAPLAKIFLGMALTDKNMHYSLCQGSGKFAIAT